MAMCCLWGTIGCAGSIHRTCRTAGGDGKKALTENDILGPSEGFRGVMDYYAHAPNTRVMLERLAEQFPTTLACMHGSAWRGDGAALLRTLAGSLEKHQAKAA